MIATVLDRSPDFAAVDPTPDLPGPARGLGGSDHCLRTNPAADGLDGFFAALLVREGDPATGAAGGEAS